MSLRSAEWLDSRDEAETIFDDAMLELAERQAC